MGTSRRAIRVFYLCHEFPVLTQTFTILEVRGLVREGIDVEVISCRRPREDGEVLGAPSPTVLPRPLSGCSIGSGLFWLFRRPIRTLSLLFRIAFATYRDQSMKCRVRGLLQFMQGARLAMRIRAFSERPHLHAQFVDAASTVAWVAATLARTTFSVTNHTAYNPYLLRPKLRSAARFFSISEFDRDDVLRTAGVADAPNLRVVRQGIDLDAWEFRTVGSGDGPAEILSVAALREKKGHHILIRAAGLLRDRGFPFRLTIVGDGPMRASLEEEIAALGLEGAVRLVGAETPDRVRERMGEADLFVLAAVVAANGDLDGVPISLMEAMAAGVPVVSTRLSGIPELVEDACLAEPGDPDGLADRIVAVRADAAGVAERARAIVERDYDTRRNVAGFAAELVKAAEGLPPA
jgi:glycosyltransferase involved in cell wall biosynthesis